MKVIHCGDVHLDSGFAGRGLERGAATLRNEELKECFARVIDLVAAEEPDLFLIAGDLFEHRYARKSTLHYVRELLHRRIPRIPVFISPGNHDPLLPDSYYRTLDWPDTVTIFGPAWTEAALPEGARLYGWGFDRWRVDEHILADLRVRDPERLNLVLLHGSDVHVESEEGLYLPLTAAEALACGADYIALGHYHGAHRVADRPGGRGPLCQYPGAPASLSFGQSPHHGVWIGEVDKERTAGRLVAVDRREHRRERLPVTGAATLEEVADRIAALLPPDAAEHFYRIDLEGDRDPDLDLDLGLLARKLEGRCRSLQLRDRSDLALDLASLAGENTLPGRVVRRFQERLAELRRTDPSGPDHPDGPGSADEASRRERLLHLALAYSLDALQGKAVRLR